MLQPAVVVLQTSGATGIGAGSEQIGKFEAPLAHPQLLESVVVPYEGEPYAPDGQLVVDVVNSVPEKLVPHDLEVVLLEATHVTDKVQLG